jgi:LacI family transcriptional regulator
MQPEPAPADRPTHPSAKTRVRIEDVAKAAGVSMKTVSRVLNHEPTVKEETRKRVEEVAKALNYWPDLSARSLAGHKSYLVGLLYDNPSANYMMQILTGVVGACKENHYGMVVHPVEYHSPQFLNTIASLVASSKLDGLILTPPITDSDVVLDLLDQLGMPYSCVSPKRQQGCIGVRLEEHDAVCDMMGHLVSLGHTRIAHIKGHPSQGASEWRLRGYHSGLHSAGLPYDPSLVIDGLFTFESGHSAANILLDMDAPPTAIFAANDDMAAGVMCAIHERGLSIPGDLSVCGFDNSPVSHQIFPALTTVNQPTLQMGHTATVQLLKSIRHAASGQMVCMPYSLMLRDSTGPAPQK